VASGVEDEHPTTFANAVTYPSSAQVVKLSEYPW
jgi:hypothetical protein